MRMQTIVFTDTNRLALKYQTTNEEVLSLINRNLLGRSDVEFLLLDAKDYQEELGNAPDWKEYKGILADFLMGMGLTPNPKLGLFIIGGDDVIPMPRIDNPLNFDNVPLQSDFLYCFKCDFPKVVKASSAQCYVGRLPLEDGVMKTSLTDDLQSYFNLANMMLGTGIEVNNVLMTSTQSWLPASNDMVKGLPIDAPYPVAEATKENMYVSPRLDLEDKYVLDFYKQDIGQADLLMFNLHGSDYPSHSSFYGEGAEGHNNPEAFNLGLFRYSSARIFNTVACFGARYIGYGRDNSMLLSAIYGGGIMLYAGSCTTALGRSGQRHVAAQDILVPSGMAESFMKLYTLYLFGGATAGEVFLRAKCDYFNTCRALDGDDAALATILMFNLYGLPTLHVNRKKDVTDEARGIKEVLPVDITKQTAYKTLYDKNNEGERGLLADVQMRVDRNLLMIRRTIENKLYTYWGLNPSDVCRIDQIVENNQPKGYRFEYSKKGNIIDSRSWAYTDNMGNVKDVIHLK